ncbi:NFACT RNA binding domain-containing protein [soil metagenome]
MSNAIRYDSLLVRELARELNDALAGARLDAVYFDRDRLRMTLLTRAARRGADPPPRLLWQLHPESGHLTEAPAGAAVGRVQIQPAARIASISAPPDERIVVIDLDVRDGAPGTAQRIVVELITNQWNALAMSADERIVAVLRERATKERMLRAGAVYAPPRASNRSGATAPLTTDEWLAIMDVVPPGERLQALPRSVAYSSPQNAAWIIGDADLSTAPAALERALHRYHELAWSGALRPVLLRDDHRWQPYVEPSRHAPADTEEREPATALLQAFASAAERAAAAPSLPDSTEEALAAVAERLDAVDNRIRRLREEQAGAAEEGRRLRTHADVLLSNLHRVDRGADRVILEDFEGATIEVALDPSRSPSDNATRLYDAARKRDRAAARIPSLLRAAGIERSRLEALAARVQDGSADAPELERLRTSRSAPGRDAPPPLPYRLYRTTAGLEVRVGRGSRSNDELTFRHSSPNDVWLHARDVAGAHVILRWPHADSNPSAIDIAEAAVLAALHSRARSSGTVPVDWTRRKYVRKPRKAGPGLVLPERVRTVFVEPDPKVEERLRQDFVG